MNARARVQLTDERGDRPQWPAVVGVGLIGLAAGVVVAVLFARSGAKDQAAVAKVATAVEHRERPAPEAAHDSGGGNAAPPVAVDDVPLTVAAPAIETSTANAGANAPAETAGAAPAAPLEQSATPPAPSTAVTADQNAPSRAVAAAAAAPAPATSAQHTIVRGQLAYLRCEGVPLLEGPYPCPRDRRFERQVWSAIDGLQQCALPELGTPDVELRVEFRVRGGRHVLDVRPADGSEAFSRAALACLEPALASVRTQLRPIFMVVAFRFEVQ